MVGWHEPLTANPEFGWGTQMYKVLAASSGRCATLPKHRVGVGGNNLLRVPCQLCPAFSQQHSLPLWWPRPEHCKKSELEDIWAVYKLYFQTLLCQLDVL